MAHYSFLFPIAGKVLETLGSPLIKRLSLAWGMKDDLEKLENTISSIHAVLLDADEKQHQEGNHQLKDWLGKLKTALFEADDLLDDFQIHSLRHQALHQSIKGKVSGFFKPDSNQIFFQFKMSNKIKKTRQRFDEIASDRNKFNLEERLVERDVVMQRVGREMTHSFIDESGVVGRSLDKENIIQRLLHTDYDEKLPIVPIVGIGGLGKTTLAQMVYNDKRISDHFDMRIWVCVSDDFALRNVILKILESVTGNCKHLEIDQLQLLLSQNLQDKKYLLVLDDVWNEERDKWIKLMDLLSATSAAGSRVVVTARSALVAAVVAPTTRKYKLEALLDDECLSLFFKWEFRNREDANQHPNLVEIGRGIVKKCKGNPLAVRTLGKLLYMKTDMRDWEYVRNNDIWETGKGEGDILPALKLSYYQLPSNIKQCFAYCALFPKDYEFFEDKLVDLWRAQGLLRSEQYKTLEEIGKDYFGLLHSRGFYQKYKFYGYKQSYKMHDLVHDFAISVAKPACISAKCGQTFHRSLKVQHLSLTDDGARGDPIPDELKQQLRSFLLFQTQEERYSTFSSFIGTTISSFKLLRVLQLFNYRGNELSSSIGSLRHLRYLDLSDSFHITSVPLSVCNLVCLETLNLTGCVKLERIPEGLGKLIRLKCLRVTTKERCLPEKEFRSLTALQTLKINQCGNMEYLLSNEGMKHLSSLCTLVIHDCKTLVSLPTNGMRQLHNLESLAISYCEKLDLQMDDDHYSELEGGVRAGLRSLHLLYVCRLPTLVTLPLWLLHGASTLRQIFLYECFNFTTLMPESLLKNLVFLQLLQINGCPELKSLPTGTHHLTALKQIRLRKCPQLVSRCMRGTGEDWHKISHVRRIFLDGTKI